MRTSLDDKAANTAQESVHQGQDPVVANKAAVDSDLMHGTTDLAHKLAQQGVGRKTAGGAQQVGGQPCSMPLLVAPLPVQAICAKQAMQKRTLNVHAILADKCHDMHMIVPVNFPMHVQEFPQAKAANDAAVDKKQDIGDSKLNSDPDKQIGVGHVDGHVVESAATGRYTAAKLHVPTLHACITRICMHMLCRGSRVVTESASRFRAWSACAHEPAQSEHQGLPPSLTTGSKACVSCRPLQA